VGATGGVGVQVVQLTAAAGATVAGTSATEAEAELLRNLGATAVIDRTGDVVERAREVFPDGADVIIHLTGDPKVAAAAPRDGARRPGLLRRAWLRVRHGRPHWLLGRILVAAALPVIAYVVRADDLPTWITLAVGSVTW
jgi:threonine dehydrogenase-like Zn-dependent dehydrogenase